MPGHTIKFRAVSVEEAQEAYRRREALLKSIKYEATHSARIAVVMDDAISDILGDDGEPLALPATAEQAGSARRGTARIGGASFEFHIDVRRLDA